MTKKTIEVISLIFKSVDYLNLIYNEFKKMNNSVDDWNVYFRIVANNATDEVLEKLKTLDFLSNFTMPNLSGGLTAVNVATEFFFL